MRKEAKSTTDISGATVLPPTFSQDANIMDPKLEGDFRLCLQESFTFLLLSSEAAIALTPSAKAEAT
jgi:hypothetical protein